MPEHEQRLSLIRRAVAGDQAALTLLLTQSHDALARRLNRRIPANVRGSLEADDVIQQVCVAAFREIRRFELRQDDSFDRWLATIAIRMLRNEVKARRALKRGGGRAAAVGADPDTSMVALLDLVAAPGRTASRSLVRREAVLAMQRALDALPPDYRQALVGVYIDAKSVADVAAEMGRTERAVHNLCFKAKHRLGEILGDDPRL